MIKKLWHNHTFSVIIWTIAVIIGMILLPNIPQLVREKGQVKIPASAQSQVAQVIQNHWGRHEDNTYQIVAIFNNGNKKLTAQQNQEIDQKLTYLNKNKQKYGITKITAPRDNSETKKQLISKDKTTQIVQLLVAKKHGTIRAIDHQLTNAVKIPGIKTYITGTNILNDDFIQATEQGIKKTEVIATIFIFIVLILVFRSPVVPIVSLLTVGVSFLISLSVVTNLVAKANFPFSNFTQVFMVVVMFGIGTDYNILLYDQFKEELSKGLDKYQATHQALRTAGRTILYSGSSILIGFSALFLAQFSIYRSASGVAIGVAILLLAILTFNPFFMMTLGRKMFWPTKNFSGPSNNKMWKAIATHSIAHPLLAIGLVLLCTVPFIFTNHSKLNYDDIVELSDNLPAKEGFHVVQKHFSKGTAEPSTLYIKTDHPLDNERDLKILDEITQKLQKLPDVETVASVTEPGGSPIKQLYVKDQMNTVTDGMNTSSKAITTIQSGLNSASNQIANSNLSGGLNGVQTLINGTNQLIAGSNQLSNGLGSAVNGAGALSSGISKLQSGSNSLASGLSQMQQQVNAGAAKMSSSQQQQLITGLSSIQNGLNQLNTALNSANTPSTSQITNNVQSIGNNAKDIGSKLQSLQQQLGNSSSTDPSQLIAQIQQALAANGQTQLTAGQTAVLTAALKQMTQQAQQQQSAVKNSLQSVASDTQNIGNSTQALATQLQSLQSTADQLGTLKQNVQKLTAGANQALPSAQQAITQLHGGLTQVQAALNAAVPGSQQLASGINQLASGSNQLMSGLETMNGKVPSLTAGLNQLNNGQRTMYSTLAGAVSQMNALQNGLSQGASGLGQVNNGVNQLNGYISGLKRSAAAKTFYIPEDQIHSKSFEQSIASYMSANKHATKMTIVLSIDPSSQKAMSLISRMNKEVKASLKGTSLQNATIAIGGQTATVDDTQKIANNDFIRTAVIMVCGIALALMFITRSILQPLYIFGTLLLAYFSSLSITRLISQYVLHQSMLTWNTPFFGFIMLIALGVDYSIFLMMKYRELSQQPGTIADHITHAANIIGTVVLSAAIILSGTFAALMPSDVLVLIQVALTVIIGLIILVFAIPVIIPSLLDVTYGKTKKTKK